MAGIGRLFLGLMIAVVVAALFPAAADAEDVAPIRFSLLLVCDVYEMAADADGRGGMAKIAGAIAAERAQNANLIVVHAGDTLSPSLMSGLDQGAHMIDLLNLVRPDMFVPGNHEFDFGAEIFLKRMGEAHFPVYAANLRDRGGNPLAHIQEQTMTAFGDLQVGIVGLTAEDSAVRSSPGDDLVFAESVGTAIRLVREMRANGADIVILAVHERREIDNALIAESGADIILSGDDHDLLIAYNGKVAFAEAMQDGLYLTVVDVEATVSEKDGKRKVKWWPNFRIIDPSTAEPDPAVAARVADYAKELSAELDVAIGRTETELDSRNAAVRGGEAVIGNLYADAIRIQTGAEISILNGGGLRANRVYPAGSEISRRDVLAELPFGNFTYMLEISGANLKQTLEQGFARAENLTGGFPQVSNMTVRADVTRPAGDRVMAVMIGGEPLDENRLYRLATNDFLARGGDGYDALKSAKILVGQADAKLIANHVMAYIRAQGTVAPKFEGRVIVARAAEAK